MPVIETNRTLAQIAREVNAKAKVAEEALHDLFTGTPREERHSLMCAIVGVITEIALHNLTEGQEASVVLNHLEDLIHVHHHAYVLTNMDREERVQFCFGCDKDGECMAQELLKDWEEHEGVQEQDKS
jgi:hypothetical protein